MLQEACSSIDPSFGELAPAIQDLLGSNSTFAQQAYVSLTNEKGTTTCPKPALSSLQDLAALYDQQKTAKSTSGGYLGSNTAAGKLLSAIQAQSAGSSGAATANGLFGTIVKAYENRLLNGGGTVAPAAAVGGTAYTRPASAFANSFLRAFSGK